MKLIRVPDDLLNRLVAASNSQGNPFSDYVIENLEQAVRADELGCSLKEIVDSYERRMMQKDARSGVKPSNMEISPRKEESRCESPEETLHKEVSKSVPILESESMKAHERITDEMARVVGNVSIPDGREIRENMVVHGNLKLGSRCHVYGSLSVFGEVEVGEESIVEGHILAEGRISIGRKVKVAGIVDSTRDIILEENATVEAVSTERSVSLASGARINRRVLAGESLLTETLSVRKWETELPAEDVEKKPRREAPPPTSPFNAFFREKEGEEIINEKNRLFRSLQERLERLDSLRKREIDESLLKKLSLKEAEVYKLAVSGHDIDGIGLRLLMDPVQVREILNSLIDRNYLDEYLRPMKVESTAEVAEKTAGETKKPKKLSVDEVFEGMLASKLRSEIREKVRRGAEERERLSSFLSELSERLRYREPKIVKEERLKGETETVETRPEGLTGFPMKVFGEVFHVGDGVTAVVGDVEIPSGAIVDKPLVVKGKLKIGANSRILKNLKALGGISIADGCSVKARLASGDFIELGENTVIEGDVHAESHIILSQGAGIYGLVDAGGAYVSVGNPTSKASGRGEENGEHNH